MRPLSKRANTILFCLILGAPPLILILSVVLIITALRDIHKSMDSINHSNAQSSESIARIHAMFDTMNSNIVNGTDRSFEQIHDSFDTVEDHLGSIERKMDSISHSLDSIETHLSKSK